MTMHIQVRTIAGATLECGCWTWWGVMPGQAEGDRTGCENHGVVNIAKANVTGPFIPQQPGERFWTPVALFERGVDITTEPWLTR